MIQSNYVLDILDIILDDFESADYLKKQIPFLTEIKREHTGIGLFIYFGNDALEKNTGQAVVVIDSKKNHSKILDGLEIKNIPLNILAEAILHLKGDMIDCLEIINKNGEGYPSRDPENYELTQLWTGSKKRKIIRL